MRLKKLLGKSVYTDSAMYFDDVEDAVVELGKGGGAVIGLKTRKVRRGVIPFEKVRSIGDIIIVSTSE